MTALHRGETLRRGPVADESRRGARSAAAIEGQYFHRRIMLEKIMTLVAITEQSHDVVLGIAYVTASNFTGKPVYARPLCFLHTDAAVKLEKAIALAEALDLRLKIFDAFRPSEAQWVL